MSKIISTSFAKTTPFTIENLRVSVFVAIGFVAAVLIYMFVSLLQTEENVAQLEDRNDSLREQYKEISSSSLSLPANDVLEELDRKVKLVNSLVNIVGDNTVAVLSDVEKTLPKEAMITSISHKAKLGQIDLTVKSTDSLSLTAFVHDLESNERFNQVLIRRQSHDGQNADATSYDIRIIQANGE